MCDDGHGWQPEANPPVRLRPRLRLVETPKSDDWPESASESFGTMKPTTPINKTR